MPAEGPDDSLSTTYTAQMPRPVFTVSVTGHRVLDADNAYLQEQVDELLQVLGKYCQCVDNDTDLRMISALAAGADQFLAERAMQVGSSAAGRAGWELQVVLPFSRTSYRAGLEGHGTSETSASVVSFDSLIALASSVFVLGDLDYWPDARSEADTNKSPCEMDVREAYGTTTARHRQGRRFRTLARLLVRQADLLVALWDGQPDRGPGGTAEVVNFALQQGKSVLRICPVTAELTLLQPKPGQQDPIELLVREMEEPGSGTLSGLTDRLQSHVNAVLVPPSEKKDHQPGSGPYSSLPAYVGIQSRQGDREHVVNRVFWKFVQPYVDRDVRPERTRNFSYSFVYQQFQWLMSPGWSGNPGFCLKTDYLKDRWLQGVQPEQARPAFIEAADRVLKKPSITADAIATSRGHAYRSSYIITFIGAVFAVWVGLAGLYSGGYKYRFVGAELLVLACLILFYMFARHRDWHWRWINARHVTESLRGQRLQAWMGFSGRRDMLSAMPWTLWFVNATVATVGLQAGTFNRQSARPIAVELKGHVQEQRDWHQSNFQKLEHMHELLDKVGWWCVVAVLGIAALYVLMIDPAKCYGWQWCESYEILIKYTVTVLCAALPLLAAALAGIRYQGDFERFATRSQETAEELDKLSARLDQFIAQVGSEEPANSAESQPQPLYEELLECVLDVSHIFESDLADWRYVYLARPSPSPA